jgi:hypothetical protein
MSGEMERHPDCVDHTDGYPWDCACWRKAPAPKVGDRVRVHPGPARGLPYDAVVEAITTDKAKIRPLTVALSKPTWARSTRARAVRLTQLQVLP